MGDTKKYIHDLRISNGKIKEAEQKCRAFIKYAGDSIFILNNDLWITDINDSACELLGYSRQELFLMKISDIMPEYE